MTHCPACDATLPDDAAFCPKCGHSLADEPPDRTPAEALASRRRSASREEPEEEELWRGYYSPKAMIGVWVGMGILTFIALVFAILNPFALDAGWLWLGTFIVLVLAWGIPLVRYAIRRFSVSYRLTNQRFFHTQGILRKVTNRIELLDVDDVQMRQGIIERFVGVGTIGIISSDRSHPELSLPGIENVETVMHMLDDARRAERRRRALHIESI